MPPSFNALGCLDQILWKGVDPPPPPVLQRHKKASAYRAKEVPLLAILTRNVYSNFSPEFLSICEYNSRQKTACYRSFKNRDFVRACMEKMMDHQYEENGAKNIYSNWNQMRAYVEYSSKQSKILYLNDLSIKQSTKL